METTDIKGGATPEEILQNVYKQLGAVIGKTEEKQRNANTLADAVKVAHCPTGLVGCNSAALTEATAGILNCPPLDKAPDPLIVDPFGVCYAPESLREEWKGKKVSIDDLINEYSKTLLENLQNSNNLRRAMEEAANGATNRVAVNNVFTGSADVAAAATTAGISFGQASAFLSVFSDKVSTEGARMLASFVRSGSRQEILQSLYVAMLFSRTNKASVLRNFNTLGRTYSVDTPPGFPVPWLPRSFLAAIGSGGSTGNFWQFSLKMIVLSTFSKVHDGYFVAIAASKDAYEVLGRARQGLVDARRRAASLAGGEAVAGGEVEGGGTYDFTPPQSVEDAQKVVTGASKAFQFKQVEIAEALTLAFSAESMKAVNIALGELTKVAPSLQDVPGLGSKLLESVRDLYNDSKRLAEFMGKGAALAAAMPRALSDAERAAQRAPLSPALQQVQDAFARRRIDQDDARARRDDEAAVIRARSNGIGNFNAAYAERFTPDVEFVSESGPLGVVRSVVGAATRVVGAATRVVGAATRTVGLSAGMYDDYTSDSEEFYGGEDMSPEMREFLEGGELSGGLVTPAHVSPSVIRKAVGHRSSETADEKKVRDQLAAKGFPVTVFEVGSCPTSVNKTGNTYGTGNKWVETKNPWALCQAQMGYQFKTPHGFCYPEGMSCYDNEDLKGARKTLERTLDKAAIWQTLASTLNAIKKTEFDQWATKKRAEIRADPANYEISEKEVEEIVQLHMPEKYKGIPNSMAVQTMVTVSAELANAIDELNPKNDDAERKLLSEILEKSGTFEASWRDADVVRQDQKIDAIASRLVEDASKCAAENIKQNAEVPRDIRSIDGCKVLDIGGEKAHVPSDVFNRIDLERLEKGEAADPLVMWWRKYDHAKKIEHEKKVSKLRAALNPSNAIARKHSEDTLSLAAKAVGVPMAVLQSHIK